MTSTLLQDFNERAQEVSKYFYFLKNLEQVSIQSSIDDDLKKNQERVICYLREILENIEMYISNQKYLQRNEQNSENN